MKKITLLLAFLCISLLANAQATCSQTFTVSGQDDGPTVLTINATDLTCQGAGAITALQLINAADSLNSGFCTTDTTSWFGFDLSIDGGAAVPVCEMEINGTDITGFTTLTITSHDDDAWSDGIDITIDVEVTFTPTTPPNCDAMLTSPTNGDLAASNDGILTWTPASGGATGYFLTVGTTPGGNDVLATTDVGNVLTYSVGVLAETTPFYVTIEPFNDLGAATGCTEYSFTTYTAVPADICGTALTVNCGDSLSGTTVGATTNGEQTGTCGTGTGAPGVWYNFTGNGDAVTASLCGSAYDTKIQVYEGDCANLVCVDGNDDSCGLQSEVTFISTVGTEYYIYVFGFGTSTGDYTLDLTCTTFFAPITADITTYTSVELVNPVLVDIECAAVSNIVIGDHSAGTDQTGLSYFTNGGGDFPFDDGVILSSGAANDASGPYDGNSPSGPAFPGGGAGDADLENILNLGAGSTNDGAFIAFDFVPIAPQISFNFLMASSEYNGPNGTFQCTYEDAFSFILTHVGSGTVTNLAVLPTSDTGNFGVSVTNIHPDIPGGCPAVNELYFEEYTQQFGNMAYQGRTVPLTAFSAVIPGDIYTIKLVVADQGDSAFDTAVFIEGGSFALGSVDLGDDVFLGDPAALCEGDVTTLNAGVTPNGTEIKWYKDGVEIEGSTMVNPVTGDTEEILNIDVTGDYTVEFTFIGTDCSTDNTVHMEFYPNPTPNLGDNVVKCANEELTLYANVENISDPNMGPLSYVWTYNGVVIPGATSDSYTIDATTVVANTTGSSESVQFENPVNNTTTAVNTTINLNTSNSEVVYSLGTFTVTATDDVTMCNGTTTVEVDFYENANCVTIPSGISPNGDGVNDCLVLDNLAPNGEIARLQVFNRYGTRVYDKANHEREWCGTNQDGNALPTGTYYYVLNYKNGMKPYKGWIYINVEN